MFERPESGERAVLVHVFFPDGSAQEDLQEFTELVSSAGATIVATVTGTRAAPEPKLFVGKGKAEEIHATVKRHKAELVIFNHSLSPSQERNLERLFSCRVIARTGLILDIFAQRARSFEGKLQVELAQLTHLSTRLVRGWTHLERQKGGIGLRGPGETQLESDRRMIGQTIKRLHKRLDRVEKRRQQGRQQRHKQEIPTVSLVGYTNAGKSTLFNCMCDAGVEVADQLFATLDPTLRRLDIPDRGEVVLADTVGFIRDLPHELIAAFKSTLEETRDARLLLHVIDCSDPAHLERIGQVEEVLKEVGANFLPVIHVYNKADILGVPPRIDRADTGMPMRVWLSAMTGEGVGLLLAAIADYLYQDRVRGIIRLEVSQARLRSLIYEAGQVLTESPLDDGGWQLQVEFARRDFEKLQSREQLSFCEEPGAQSSVVA